MQNPKNEMNSPKSLESGLGPNSLGSKLTDKIKIILDEETTKNTVALIERFDGIEKKSQLEQGNVLIDLSEIAKKKGIYFKDLIKTVAINTSLTKITEQHRARLMRSSFFFNQSRPMTGISVTVGYEIAAQKNEEIALQLYSSAVGKNLSVKEIRELADRFRSNGSKKMKKPPLPKVIELTAEASKVIQFMIGDITDDPEKMFEIVTNCCRKLNEQLKNKNTIEGSFTS